MGKSVAPPPSAVTTMVLEPQTWEPSIRVIGTLKAVQGLNVSTDLAGIVAEIAFDSGKTVKKGDLLVQLNADQEKAQLAAAEARRDLAKLEAGRKRELQSQNAAPASERDAADAELRRAEAACAEVAALLARKRVTAPFDGIIGIRQVSLGQYLNPGAAIATMHSLDPIRVQFNVPQQQMGSTPAGARVRIVSEGSPELVRDGVITALDSQVSEASRAITVEATLQNADRVLRPGMFVNVEIPMPKEEGVFVVPASSISYAPYGDSVYVVKESSTPEGKPTKIVNQQFVKVGQNRGDQIRILSGLSSGDEIVTSGVFKLRPGGEVQINNNVKPPAEASPKPPNS
jgi:membrane fusion protein (multidrug efflux system)